MMDKIESKSRRKDIDLLKGFAIIAVVLYHMGLCESGYLGVDVFFVISGFLITPKVVKEISDNQFNYILFLERRVLRLLPLLLIVVASCLVAGYWIMLPDDYENLSQSVIASSVFSNNILSLITNRDYWALLMEYKPLMHTWYLGVLFEYYLIFPLILQLAFRVTKDKQLFGKTSILSLGALSMVSLGLYLIPIIDDGSRFYLLPCRFFELAWGGVASLFLAEYKEGFFKLKLIVPLPILYTLFSLLLLIIFFGVFSLGNGIPEPNLVHLPNHVTSCIPRMVLLTSVVVLTSVFVFLNSYNQKEFFLYRLPFVTTLGAMSYSMFMWHQPVIAFCRYLSYPNISLLVWAVVFVIVLVISWLTYRFVENKVSINNRTRIITLVSFVIVNAAALIVYAKGGIVRDVPELYIINGRPNEISLIDYNDRVSSLDVDFPESDSINVLVVGNSFARDWVNVMLESEVKERINISYVRSFEDCDRIQNRISQSNYVFVFGWKHSIPSYVWEYAKPETEIWGIGTKNYGKHNGVIYKNRRHKDYYSQTMKIDSRYYEWNELLKNEWGDKYIDLLGLSTARDGRVYVFTNDNVFISPDCRHLSKGGASFFAKQIDWRRIIK